MYGADYSFRHEEFNRLFCKSNVDVIYTIIATKLQKLAAVFNPFKLQPVAIAA